MEEYTPEKRIVTQEKFQIRIEIAGPEDWEEFKNLRLQVFAGEDAPKFGFTEENTEERMVEEKAMGQKEWLHEITGKNFGVLSWDGSEVVGMGLVERRDQNNEWFFYSGYVKEDYRRLGIGQKIFATRLKEIRKRGGGKVAMAVKATNQESIKLAEKFGFKKGESYLKGEGFFMELSDVNNPITINKIKEVLDEG